MSLDCRVYWNSVRAARAFTSRERIACCGYHGWQDWYIGSTARHAGVPDAVRSVTRRVLEVIQTWLADERFAESLLVVVTEDAVATTDDAAVDITGAPVWGLVRAAQAEHPDRFAVVDIDGDEGSSLALPAAVAAGEPELAVREGRLYVPRLVKLPGAVGGAPAFDGDGVVLITGGTGGLGALVARHVVSRHGVRRLVLELESRTPLYVAGPLEPEPARSLPRLVRHTSRRR